MQFSELMASVSGAGSEWRVAVTPDWQQGRTLFGGLQAALAVQAMRGLIGNAAPLRTLQTTFIAPIPAGDIRIATRVLRSGRSATQVEAQLFDGEQLACAVLGIFGLSRESVLAIAPPWPGLTVEPPEARELRYVEGVTPAFTQYLNFRWASGGFPFRGAAEPKTQIYVRLREDRPVGELQLIALADSIPSPGLSVLNTRAQASSMTWMLELLRPDYDPAGDAWWLMDAEVNAAQSGYLSQAATLWSPDRKAVALSRQSVVAFA
ncbi:acyl-CoA thioesterase [Solimonas terrae]|uniref:Thioesterase family protein n=1 Tax=Solimonas terrae TaxID=1396819 RepID=A0A6M2BR33_9GAMM|nr:thioesterase family protein [Solimonas terrae]NGY04695.1 thioesterase family protein [Solimonas terrae]